MAPHSSTLAWKIPWTEEPGGLPSMGSHRVGHAWVTSLSLFTFMHWRRKWQPTPVFLPGESQGRVSLVGCRLWGLRVGHDRSDLAAADKPWTQLLVILKALLAYVSILVDVGLFFLSKWNGRYNDNCCTWGDGAVIWGYYQGWGP